MIFKGEFNLSLKIFHIIFITCSVILSFGFSGWLLRSYTLTPDASYFILAMVSLMFGIGLVIYEIKIAKRL